MKATRLRTSLVVRTAWRVARDGECPGACCDALCVPRNCRCAPCRCSACARRRRIAMTPRQPTAEPSGQTLLFPATAAPRFDPVTHRFVEGSARP